MSPTHAPRERSRDANTRFTFSSSARLPSKCATQLFGHAASYAARNFTHAAADADADADDDDDGCAAPAPHSVTPVSHAATYASRAA